MRGFRKQLIRLESIGGEFPAMGAQLWWGSKIHGQKAIECSIKNLECAKYKGLFNKKDYTKYTGRVNIKNP